MKNIIKILLLIFSVLLISCSKGEKISVIEEEDIETQMIEAFREGHEELNKGDVLYAAKKFNEAELLYPQSVLIKSPIVLIPALLILQRLSRPKSSLKKTLPGNKISMFHRVVVIMFYNRL